MPEKKPYEVVVTGTSREVYRVLAGSIDEVREMYEMSALGHPFVTEIFDDEITEISGEANDA